MKKVLKINPLFVLLTLFLVCPSQPAQAYLDPGSGSYIIQIVIAALAGAIIPIKIFWRRISAFFSRAPKGNQAAENTKENDNEK